MIQWTSRCGIPKVLYKSNMYKCNLHSSSILKLSCGWKTPSSSLVPHLWLGIWIPPTAPTATNDTGRARVLMGSPGGKHWYMVTVACLLRPSPGGGLFFLGHGGGGGN